MAQRTCSVEGCDGRYLARGLCSKHYQRLRNSEDFTPQPKPDPERPCSADGCTNYGHLKGMCTKHYHRMRRHGTTDDSVPKAAAECSVEGCTDFVRARGLCAMHVGRWYRTGSTDPGPIDPFKRCGQCERLLPREQFPNTKRRVCEDCWPLYRQEQLAKQMQPRLGKKFRHTVTTLIAAQGNRCAICGCLGEDAPRKRLVLDHDHATGRIRAMLCLQCNSGLGQFRDSPELLAAAIRYLQEHRPGDEQLPLFAA